jgi:hypothetical protein
MMMMMMMVVVVVLIMTSGLNHFVQDYLIIVSSRLGPIVLGSPAALLWVWTGIRLWKSIDGHSGQPFDSR